MLIVNLRAEQWGKGWSGCAFKPCCIRKRVTRKVEVALLVKHRAGVWASRLGVPGSHTVTVTACGPLSQRDRCCPRVAGASPASAQGPPGE